MMDLPRGMRDLGEADVRKIEHVREAFMQTALLYDYPVVDPSPLELLPTLEARSGPGIRDEIYGFFDKGGREVGLRFDFTVGLTRQAGALKSAKLPMRAAAFGGVFRYDEPQKGRYRHFHQWDVEMYGHIDAQHEAEVIELTSGLFERLGLSTVLRVSHRQLIQSYIEELFGGEPSTVSDMLRAVDKIQKKSITQITQEFSGYDADKISQLIEFANTKGTIPEVEAAVDTGHLKSWGELAELFHILDGRGVKNAIVDFGIVRGLDYYSGMVFEVYDGSGVGALAGGGRYDSLPAALGRPDLGATGVAGGVERTILAMDAQNAPEPKAPARVTVIHTREMLDQAVHISSMLRRDNIPTSIDLSQKPLKKQMASASGHALIIAPAEYGAGNAILKDMATGAEEAVPLSELGAVLRERAR